MNLAPLPNSPTDITTNPADTRNRSLEEGRIILVHNLDISFGVSLRIGCGLGRYKRTKDKSTTTIGENEKSFFKHLPDDETVPTGGIIELWKPVPGSPDKYVVTKYTRLK